MSQVLFHVLYTCYIIPLKNTEYQKLSSYLGYISEQKRESFIEFHSSHSVPPNPFATMSILDKKIQVQRD